MSNSIEKVYFCSHRLDVYWKIAEVDRIKFSFDFKFDNTFHRINKHFCLPRICFKNPLNAGRMFHKIFSKKKQSLISLNRFLSANLLVNGKIVVGYFKGHETIILFFFIDGFKEKTVRLSRKKVGWWKNWSKSVKTF